MPEVIDASSGVLILPSAGAPGTSGADGADGRDGQNGRDGQVGASGQNAYQVWLAAGNTGSVSDYIASLKGQKGDQGAGTTIKGAVANYPALPTTGMSMGDVYLMQSAGTDPQGQAYQPGDGYVYKGGTPPWQYVGPIRGPKGDPQDAAGVSTLIPNVMVTETGGSAAKSVPDAFAGKFDKSGGTITGIVQGTPPVPDWLNRVTPYGTFTINLGGLPADCLPGGGTVAAFAAIQGFVEITTQGQNNQSTFAAGVSGIARAVTSNPSPVGLFGGGICNTPDSVTAQVFGGNFVATNQRNFNPNSTTGVKRAEVYCIENDMEIHPADDGSAPIVNARGIWTVGNSRIQPTGEFTAYLVGPAGILRNPVIPFKKSFRSQEGAANVALEVCMSAATGQSGSQPVNFVAMGPDAVKRTATISADAYAGLFVRSDTYFVYSNMAGATQWSWSNTGMNPGLDNVQDIGTASNKIRNLYIGNSPVVGSDARLKVIRGDGSLTDNELDAWGDVDPTIYRMKAAIAEKSEAAARLHVGYIAQRIIAAFKARKLDAFAYGLVCEEGLMVEVMTPGVGTFRQARYVAVTVPADDGSATPIQRYREELDPVTGEPLYDEVELPTEIPSTEWTGETQLSVRYDECQVWQAAWQRRENARSDARLAALEAKAAA